MSNSLLKSAMNMPLRGGPRKSVLILMADIASDDGSGVWISKPKMAEKLGISESTVRRALSSLLDIGVIAVSGNRPCSNGHTVEYSVVHEAIRSFSDPCHSDRCHSDTPVTLTPHPCHSDTPPLSERHPTPVRVTPDPCQSDTQTINEPPLNPPGTPLEEDDDEFARAHPSSSSTRQPYEMIETVSLEVDADRNDDHCTPIFDGEIQDACALQLEVAKAAGVDTTKISGLKWIGPAYRGTIEAWMQMDLTWDEILAVVRDVMSRKSDGPPASPRYFDKPMAHRANGTHDTGGYHGRRNGSYAERLAAEYEKAHAWLAGNPF